MGCIKKILSNPIVQPIADIAATATGNPEFIPLINGGIDAASTLANGGSFGKALGQGAIGGAEGFAGQEAVGALGAAFPETAGSLGLSSSGNSLSDALGFTSGAGSLAGPGTLGGDVSNLFSGASSGAGSTFSGLLSGGSSGADTVPASSVGQLTDVTPTADPTSPLFNSGTSSSASLASPSVDLSSGGGASTYGTSGSLNSAYDPASSYAAPGGNAFSGAAASPNNFASTLSTSAPASTGLASLLKGGSGLSTLAQLAGGANTMLATNRADATLKRAGAQSNAAEQPFLASGTAANASLSNLLGTSGNTGAAGYGSLTTPFTPQDLQNDPGYQFQEQQGQQALDRQNAKAGDYFSGAALKGAQDYSAGLAGTTFNNAFQRNLSQNQATFGDLSSASNSGQTAAANIGNTDTSIGSAKANAGIAGANTIASSLSSLLNGTGAKKPVNIGGQIVYI